MLELQVSRELVPPGAMAQIKVSLAAPKPIISGRLVMDFDPGLCGDIASAAVFSAAGDAIGVATVKGHHLDAYFNSRAGGIGSLLGLPVLVVVVPVLPSVMPGAAVEVTASSGGFLWKDDQGTDYALAVKPGTLTVGDGLAVNNVVPGDGIVPAGSVVRIEGVGFTPETAVEVDGVSVSSITFVGPERIDVTLGAPAEMTGKRIRLRNPDGSEIEYFSFVRGIPSGQICSSFAGCTVPFFPLRTYSAVNVGIIGSGRSYPTIAVQNQNITPVDVNFYPAAFGSAWHVTLPPGGLFMPDFSGGVRGDSVLAVASAPIQMLSFWFDYMRIPQLSASIAKPTAIPPQEVGFAPGPPLSWDWQIGSAKPAAQTITVSVVRESVDFTVLADTESGGRWLSVTPLKATSPSKLTVSVDPSSLSPGVYRGTITITPAGSNVKVSTLNVTLTVRLFNITPAYTSFYMKLGDPVPAPATLAISSTTPAPFAVAVSTDSGGNWLSVARSGDMTPATLTVSVNPAGLASGRYTGTIKVNTQTVPVELGIAGEPPQPMFTVKPTSVSFRSQEGSDAPRTAQLDVSPSGIKFTTSVSTDSGGNWLSAPGDGPIWAAVNPGGLAAGTYHGTITVTSPAAMNTVQISVTLEVIGGGPQTLTVTPSTLELTAEAGSTAEQVLSVESGGIPAEISVTTQGGYLNAQGQWLYTNPASFQTTFTPTTVRVSASTALPGTYRGTVTISKAPAWTVQGGPVEVPVTLTSTPAPVRGVTTPEIVGATANAASRTVGAIAPGEIVSIGGLGIGPADGAGLELNDSGKVATSLAGTRVLFDGRPAPLLYASATQTNVIVPYEVAGRPATVVEVEYNGVRSAAQGIPVARTAPGIFAVLNEDYSMNDTSNPAARGSIIQIYGTGEGLTDPPGVTGSIIHGDLKRPVERVSVTIGGVDAPVLYAGSAGESVAGLFQVNVRVPEKAGNLPVVLTVGGAHSQEGVSIAVR